VRGVIISECALSVSGRWAGGAVGKLLRPCRDVVPSLCFVSLGYW
jgi:hypothetical protein